jgi:hypothetical protein
MLIVIEINFQPFDFLFRIRTPKYYAGSLTNHSLPVGALPPKKNETTGGSLVENAGVHFFAQKTTRIIDRAMTVLD